MESSRTIRIAAAIADNGAGALLLVRKAGTRAFMQPGGKIEVGEAPVETLRRELHEELGWSIDTADARALGLVETVAANETGYRLAAELFHVLAGTPVRIGAEIEEALWLSADEARKLPLAPLTEHFVLPWFERKR